MTKTEKEVLHLKLIDYCYERCESIDCIDCTRHGKLSIPFCKISYIEDEYQVIDTKTLSCDIIEILKDIKLDFYEKNKLTHSIAVIIELIENERYKITKKGDV